MAHRVLQELLERLVLVQELVVQPQMFGQVNQVQQELPARLVLMELVLLVVE
jgi:hypothetical protein